MQNEQPGTNDETVARVRARLRQIASHGTPITYQALARDLGLCPPNTIHQLTLALEQLMEEDAAHGRPMIAALVVSKARRTLPANGFFECARRIGRFFGDSSGPEAAVFFASEAEAATAFWQEPELGSSAGQSADH